MTAKQMTPRPLTAAQRNGLAPDYYDRPKPTSNMRRPSQVTGDDLGATLDFDDLDFCDPLAVLQAMQNNSPVYCPACDSGDATVLGQLGTRVHLRCRECGIDFSHTA